MDKIVFKRYLQLTKKLILIYIDYFLIDEDSNIVRINFTELIKALEEVMKLAIEESQKIDNDAQEFIDFCEKWKKEKSNKD